MKARFTVDLQGKARKASEQAARSVFLQLNGRFQAALGAKVWSWPNVTIRSGGTTAGGTRNIVDSGLLRQSNSGPKITGLRAIYRWATPYATAVHEGAVLTNGTTLPARPWTSAVLGTEPQPGIEVFDVRKSYRDAWLQFFRGK